MPSAIWTPHRNAPMAGLHFLSSDCDAFPATRQALTAPDGLLAAGGDLRPERLLAAYQRGIFPWYSTNSPILWWSPNPRCVIYPQELHLSRRLRRFMRHCHWQISANRAFATVIQHCAQADNRAHNGWLLPEMIDAYQQLHQQGWAHSIEVWDTHGQLTGGLYGLAIGELFFAESMVSLQSGGSKLALAALCHAAPALGLRLIDAQVANPHLLTMGARLLKRSDFEAQLPTTRRPLASSALNLAVQNAGRALLHIAPAQ